MPIHYSAAIALSAVLAGGALAGPAAAAAPCDRACLRATLDVYLAAVFKHDPAAAPLAKAARATENAVVVANGDGFWKTVTGYGVLTRKIADPKSGQAAMFGLVQEGDKAAYVSVRIKVVNRKITEAEWTLGRGRDGASAPIAAILEVPPPPEGAIAPKARTSRAAMIAIANGYFQGLQDHDGSKIPKIDGCERVENGGRVTNTPMRNQPAPAAPAPGAGADGLPTLAQTQLSGDCTDNFQMFKNSIQSTDYRRFPVVDEEQGVVIGNTMFHRVPGNQTRRNLLTEYFWVRDGKLAGIYAAMFYLDPAAPDSVGWPSEGPWN